MPAAFPEARFLIVDDQESAHILLERLLRRAGYSQIRGVTDSRQALAEIESYGPDCVLLDMNMPGLSGLDVLNQIRGPGAGDELLPVLMITASEDEGVKKQAMEAGADEFLTKPVDASELTLRVGNLLRIRKLTRGLKQQNVALEERVRDRTQELERRELEAKKSAEHFRFLAELSGRMETLYDPLEVAREGLEGLLRLLGLEMGVLFQVQGDTLMPGVVVGELPPELRPLVEPRPLSAASRLFEEVLASKGPVVVRDYASWPDARLKGTRLKAVMAVPIFLGERLHSLIYLGSMRRELAEDEDPKVFLQATAGRIERALERSEHVRHLQSIRQQALRVVGLTLEYRDYETKGHTDRVTRLALRLGQALGLSESELWNLRWGSYLHDAGKVAIPDSILLKPGRLDAEEFEIVKRHVTIGEEMLRSLNFIPGEVFAIIRHHHERWDGSGYPDGLSGEDIPLLARIFAIVDVYDALTSERPYKAAWSHAQAVKEVADQKGKQFDPRLADVFLGVVQGA